MSVAEVVLSWLSRAAFSTKLKKVVVGCEIASDARLLVIDIVEIHVLSENSKASGVEGNLILQSLWLRHRQALLNGPRHLLSGS